MNRTTDEMAAPSGRWQRLAYEPLKIDLLRNYYCWIRYRLLKRRIRFSGSGSAGIGEHTIDHNLGALSERAAFGMGNRMALLLYPLAACLRTNPKAKVLIVGPRTEDDLYWAKALGMLNVRGFDLFSYSPMIDVGDIHQTAYGSGEFDAVVLGWVISYSANPDKMVGECKRLVKPGGYLGFGIESNPQLRMTGKYRPPRVNSLNSAKDVVDLVQARVVFVHDPQLDMPTDNAVLFQLP
jgi:SAM-dependent methyltransferase